MNKTIIININGIIFHIEEDAYERLQQYMNAIKQHFMYAKDSLEIVTDIENRIAEMFSDLLKEENKQVIVMNDVLQVTTQMGDVKDFETDDEQDEPYVAASYNRKAPKDKKLFRDPDERLIGGVCAGIAHYFNSSVLLVRLAFVIAFFFFGIGLIPYLILWLVMPQARNRADKMAMKGEALNLQNFKKNFEDEMAAVKNSFSNARNMAKPAGDTIRNLTENAFDIIGKLLRFFLKIVGFCIMLIAGITLISLLIGLVMFIGYAGSTSLDTLFPLSAIDQDFRTPMLVALVIVAFVPFFALLLFTIKLIFNTKSLGKSVNFSLLMIWIIGLATFLFFLSKNFGQLKEEAGFSKTELIKPNAKNTFYLRYGNERTFKPFRRIGIINADGDDYESSDHDFEDPRNLRIAIEKSDDFNAAIQLRYAAKGANFDEALQYARTISYVYTQKDSSLVFDRYAYRKKDQLWRDQKVDLNIKFPVGSTLFIERDLANDTFWWVSNDCLAEGEKYLEAKVTKDGIVCNKTEEAILREREFLKEKQEADSTTLLDTVATQIIIKN